MSVVLNIGWNLIGSLGFTTSFENLAGSDSQFISLICSYDTEEQKYISVDIVDTLSQGKGYWVRCTNNVSLYPSGTIQNTPSKDIKQGWNLISGAGPAGTYKSQYSNNNSLVSLYSYENGMYNNELDNIGSWIPANKAYWGLISDADFGGFNNFQVFSIESVNSEIRISSSDTIKYTLTSTFPNSFSNYKDLEVPAPKETPRTLTLTYPGNYKLKFDSTEVDNFLIIIGTSGITIDGEGTPFTINGSTTGIIQNGTIEISDDSIDVQNRYDDVTIKKINITASSVLANGGSICKEGFACGASNNIIKYCSANISGLGEHAGGIVGRYAASYEGNLLVSDCCVNGDFKSSKASGGIVGSDGGSLKGNLTIENCYSSITIGDRIASRNKLQCGGIAGSWAASAGKIVVNSCYTTGIIDGKECGGIVGSWCGSTPQLPSYISDNNLENYTSEVDIKNCYTVGNISTYQSGGIVGPYSGIREIFGGQSPGVDSFSKISRCYSTGLIDSPGMDADYQTSWKGSNNICGPGCGLESNKVYILGCSFKNDSIWYYCPPSAQPDTFFNVKSSFKSGDMKYYNDTRNVEENKIDNLETYNDYLFNYKRATSAGEANFFDSVTFSYRGNDEIGINDSFNDAFYNSSLDESFEGPRLNAFMADRGVWVGYSNIDDNPTLNWENIQ